jgi:hypothetical protein
LANNIVIKISSDMSGSGVTANQNTTTGGQKQQQNKPNNAGESSILNDLTKVLVVEQGKKILQNVVSQYANLTGNSIAGNRLQAVSTLTGYVTTIAVGGWVGAIGVAVDVGIQTANNLFELRKTNAQIDLLRQRVGSSTMNGSRGTYD